MESVLKKFEKNAVDLSKLYGGSDYILTGTASANYNGTTVTGTEGITIDDYGCAIMWVYANGMFHYAPAKC